MKAVVSMCSPKQKRAAPQLGPGPGPDASRSLTRREQQRKIDANRPLGCYDIFILSSLSWTCLRNILQLADIYLFIACIIVWATPVGTCLLSLSRIFQKPPRHPKKSQEEKHVNLDGMSLEECLAKVKRTADEIAQVLEGGQVRRWKRIPIKDDSACNAAYMKRSNGKCRSCYECRDPLDAAKLPLLEVENGRNSNGALPIFLAINEWQSWFPWVKSTKLLKVVNDNTAIFYVMGSLLGLTIDGALLANITPRVDIDGSFDFVLTSPSRGHTGNWFGADVPKKKAMIRFEIDSVRIKFFPKAGEKGRMFIVTYQETDIGFERGYMLFFHICFAKIAPLLANMVPKFKGSTIDKSYNGGELTPLTDGLIRQGITLKRFLSQSRMS